MSALAAGRTSASRLDFVYRYAIHLHIVIKSFAHKGLERFFRTGVKSGIQPGHAARLRLQLQLLNRARRPQDMRLPNWHLHPLNGDLAGHWSVRVSGNWRLTFKFEGEDAILVNYLDYH